MMVFERFDPESSVRHARVLRTVIRRKGASLLNDVQRQLTNYLKHPDEPELKGRAIPRHLSLATALIFLTVNYEIAEPRDLVEQQRTQIFGALSFSDWRFGGWRPKGNSFSSLQARKFGLADAGPSGIGGLDAQAQTQSNSAAAAAVAVSRIRNGRIKLPCDERGVKKEYWWW